MSELARLLNDSLEDGTFVRLVLSRRRPDVIDAPDKITVRPIELKGQRHYQLTRQSGSRQTHENVKRPQLISKISGWFDSTFEHAHLFTTTADFMLRRMPDGRVKVKRSRPSQRAVETTHNREKQYLLPEGVPVPFLMEIGVMTPEGKVRAAHYHKFRQINRYLEFVNDVVPHLKPDGPLTVVDFGCGKSYLTFALHYLLTEIHRRDVRIAGLDLKSDVIARCSAIADRLQCRGLSFHQGDIAGFRADEKIDLAVSLHACDTATDDALAAAVQRQADVILAVPCCQHEVAGQLDSPALAMMTKHGILKERFAALATDALRAQLLELIGYRTQVMEFIDLEHTAKNLLLRAIRRREPVDPRPTDLAAYREFKQLLGIETFHLETALGSREAFERIAQRGVLKL